MKDLTGMKITTGLRFELSNKKDQLYLDRPALKPTFGLPIQQVMLFSASLAPPCYAFFSSMSWHIKEDLYTHCLLLAVS